MTRDDSPIHAADRLMAAIEQRRSPVCVGIDPVLDRLPFSFQQMGEKAGFSANGNRILKFSLDVVEAVAEFVACVKIQSACFERLGTEGSALLENLIGIARKQHSIEIMLDAKRGDIGISAEHYSEAAFEGKINDFSVGADWLTINAYLGEDGISPFLRPGHGAFALVRTSNPGGDEIQNLELKKGGTVSHAVGEMITRIGSKHIGQRGYSSLGAVVGATKPQDAKRLREIMPQQIFLVPGYGAQGAGIADVLPCFKSDGTGAIVTASRSVIYAFKKDDPKWMDSVADAAAKFADEVGKAVGMR